MKGKHSKRSLLGPRATGALAGLVFFGVAATAAQAADLSSGQRSGDQVAAVEVTPKRTSDRTVADADSDQKDDRSKVIARAKTWNPHSDDRVPYSQNDTHDGYRTDCSGFVAMTLGLPEPGPNTVGLTSSEYTERIPVSELQKGDLVMDALGTNTTRHVVIFEKWVDSEHTSYWAYEQRGSYGTDHRTRDYGLSPDSEFKAYRPKKL